MSLVESGHSTAAVSLRGLLDGRTQNARDAGLTVSALARKIDTARCGEPGVLAVITATGLAYRRADGIHVVPIGTLGP